MLRIEFHKRNVFMQKKTGFFLSQACLSGDDSGDDDLTQMDHYDASFIQEQSTQAGVE
jgi:hypothetical protein